jgi:hypothetical protein
MTMTSFGSILTNVSLNVKQDVPLSLERRLTTVFQLLELVMASTELNYNTELDYYTILCYRTVN